MVNIIFFLLVMFFWYGVAVCVVQTVKHCTTREAASFCIQKIKEVFAWSWKEAFAKPPVQYMTHIGMDGERQCFNPKVADEEFVELGKLFQFFGVSTSGIMKMFMPIEFPSFTGMPDRKIQRNLKHWSQRCWAAALQII